MKVCSPTLLCCTLLLAACSPTPTADDAEQAFLAHREAFERARFIAIEHGEASGEYGSRVYGSPPAGLLSPARELNELLSGTGVESVLAERDSVHEWHVTFTLSESGLAIGGQILVVAHGVKQRGPYNEFSEVRQLGNGWYVHNYVW